MLLRGVKARPERVNDGIDREPRRGGGGAGLRERGGLRGGGEIGRGVGAPVGAAQERVVILLGARDRQLDEDEGFRPMELRGQGGDSGREPAWL